MVEEVETVPLAGKRVVWDGTNVSELREVAGSKFLGSSGTTAFVIDADNRVQNLTPGWSVVRLDGCEPGVSDCYATQHLYRRTGGANGSGS